jgi:spoIIIJ-associated protein
MSHGESVAAGTRDDEPSRELEDAFGADPAGDHALTVEAAGGTDAEPAELPADLDDAADLEDAAEAEDAADLEDAADVADTGEAEDAAEPDEAAGPAWPDGDRGEGLTVADLEQEGEIAADYVEGLLDIADLDGDIDMDVEGDRALVSVVGGELDDLVGSKGVVLEALQELTRLAVQRQTGERTRMMLDVGGYRAHRREELTEVGQDAADEVQQTGVPKRLTPMTAFERKIVHDAIAAAGLRSESEGEDPDRRVVVYPAG